MRVTNEEAADVLTERLWGNEFAVGLREGEKVREISGHPPPEPLGRSLGHDHSRSGFVFGALFNFVTDLLLLLLLLLCFKFKTLSLKTSSHTFTNK